MYRQKHAEWVDETIENLLSSGQIKKALADEFIEKFELEKSKRFIEEGFKKDRTLSWRSAFKKMLSVTQEKYTDDLKEAVRKRVVEAQGKERSVE